MSLFFFAVEIYLSMVGDVDAVSKFASRRHHTCQYPLSHTGDDTITIKQLLDH